MTAAEYADQLIQGLDLWEDPWAPADIELHTARMPKAAMYASGGLWGAFCAAICWWAYEFVTAAGPATIVAQIN